MTNEQRESERLDAFITRHLDGEGHVPPSDEAEVMVAQIARLKPASGPEPQFVAQLEARLKQQEKEMSKRFYVKYAVAAAALMVFSLVSVAFRAELQAFAQEIINLFRPAESDERTLEGFYGGMTLPTETPEEVEAEPMPSDVRYPAFVPKSYHLVLEDYDGEGASALRYACGSGDIWAFSLWQFDIVTYQVIAIGESAEIETVTLDNDAEAQYVRGEWRISEPPVIDETTQAGAPITITQVWESDSVVQHLFWQDGGTNFYLSVSGTDSLQSNPGCVLDKDTFIAIANSIE